GEGERHGFAESGWHGHDLRDGRGGAGGVDRLREIGRCAAGVVGVAGIDRGDDVRAADALRGRGCVRRGGDAASVGQAPAGGVPHRLHSTVLLRIVVAPPVSAEVPAGCVLPAVGATVNVKVTGWPKVDGMGTMSVMVVAVPAALTVCVKSADVLPA